MTTFKHVNETDERGQHHPVTLELGVSSIERRGIRYSARLPYAAILSTSARKSVLGADTVVVETAGGAITWKVRHGKGAELVEAIEGARV